MKTNPDEPISTNAGTWNDDNLRTHVGRGLTKREYFAAMAMQGLIANSKTTPELGRVEIVRHAVAHADALIEELNKNTEVKP